MRVFRKKFRKASLGLAAGGLVMMMSSGALAQEKLELVGRVIDIDGPTLKTNRLKEERWYQAYPKMKTYLKERMKADPSTTATVEFIAGGRAVVSPGTQIEIVSPRELQIVSGAAWLKFDKDRLNKETFKIQTSGGVMGIEGTEFLVETQPDGSTKLVVVEGAVRVNNGGQEQLVRGGDESNFGQQALRVANYAAYNSPESAIRDLAFGRMSSEKAAAIRPLVNRALWHVPGRYRLNRLFYGSNFYTARRALRFASNPKQALANELSRATGLNLRGMGAFGKKKPVADIAVSQGSNPKITWKHGGSKSASVVVAGDREGKDVLWFGQAKRKGLAEYPSYAPALELGRPYYVFVTPLDKKGQPKVSDGKSLANKATFQGTGHSPTFAGIGGLQVQAETGAPAVSWDAHPDAFAYHVNINDASGLVWSAESAGTSYIYPQTARALPPGSYTAQVEAFNSKGYKVAQSSLSTFASQGWAAPGLDGPPRQAQSEAKDRAVSVR